MGTRPAHSWDDGKNPRVKVLGPWLCYFCVKVRVLMRAICALLALSASALRVPAPPKLTRALLLPAPPKLTRALRVSAPPELTRRNLFAPATASFLALGSPSLCAAETNEEKEAKKAAKAAAMKRVREERARAEARAQAEEYARVMSLAGKGVEGATSTSR